MKSRLDLIYPKAYKFAGHSFVVKLIIERKFIYDSKQVAETHKFQYSFNLIMHCALNFNEFKVHRCKKHEFPCWSSELFKNFLLSAFLLHPANKWFYLLYNNLIFPMAFSYFIFPPAPASYSSQKTWSELLICANHLKKESLFSRSLT